MAGKHNDATPEVLRCVCPKCGRGQFVRCKSPTGLDAMTHKERWAAAGVPMPPRPRYARPRDRDWRRR